MSILRRAKKIRYDESGWQFIRINPSHVLPLQNEGLLPRPEEAP